LIHTYRLQLHWDGSFKESTASYTSYTRNHTIKAEGKPNLLGSSDPHFRGDIERYNPEELFLSSISSCHMLWYLHLCTDQKILVTSYTDQPEGKMETEGDGSGRFSKVVLRPEIIISSKSNLQKAHALHEQAHKMCFIANSCNFPITCKPKIIRSVE